MLAYYVYFLADEEEVINDFWKYLADGHDLKTGSSLVVETDFVPSAFPLTLLRSAENKIRVYQYLIRNIVVMVVLLPYEIPRAMEEMDKLKEDLTDVLSSTLGEGICLTASGDEAALVEDMKAHFPITSLCRTDLKEGTLVKVEGESIYGFLAGGEEECEFLRRFLPLMDLAIQKLEREKGFFRDQMTLISEHRQKIDAKVSAIMGRQLASQALEPEELEDLVEELSSMYSHLTQDAATITKYHNSFFDELYNLRLRMEKVLDPGAQENCLGGYVDVYAQFADGLKEEEKSLRLTLETIKEAIDVVQTKIALHRSRETKGLMEEGISLQVAAGFIEFIIVFYYTLSSWKILTPKVIEHYPPYIIAGAVFGLAASVAAFTHAIATAFREKKKLGMHAVPSIAAVLVFVAIIIYLNISYTGPAH